MNAVRPRRLRAGKRKSIPPAETFSLLVGLFLVAVLLHYTASLLHLPPSAMLLVGGGVLAFVPGLPILELDPELILMVFLPPLLADSAWFTALASFRRNLTGIVSLAVGAVLFTTLVVAVVTQGAGSRVAVGSLRCAWGDRVAARRGVGPGDPAACPATPAVEHLARG